MGILVEDDMLNGILFPENLKQTDEFPSLSRRARMPNQKPDPNQNYDELCAPADRVMFSIKIIRI